MMEDEKTVQMGRVLSLRHGEGYGAEILKAGIREIRKKMNPERVYIEAQCYATGYYEREGFKVCSEEFLEDGIPHVQMMLEMKRLYETEKCTDSSQRFSLSHWWRSLL